MSKLYRNFILSVLKKLTLLILLIIYIYIKPNNLLKEINPKYEISNEKFSVDGAVRPDM